VEATRIELVPAMMILVTIAFARGFAPTPRVLQGDKVDVDLGLQTGSERGTAVEKLRRWQASGGIWRVMSRTSSGVSVAFLTCDAGEEIDRLTFEGAEVLHYIGARSTSEGFTPRVGGPRLGPAAAASRPK
jgi:hypothetical protein